MLGNITLRCLERKDKGDRVMFLYSIKFENRFSEIVKTKFEVTKESPKFFWIAPRDVSSKMAQQYSVKINRNLIGEEFFYSLKDAFAYHLKREQLIIKKAILYIEDAERKIDTIKGQ